MITNSSFLIGHFTNCDLHMVMTAYQCEHGTYQGNGIERRVKNIYTLTACMKDRPLHIIYEGSTSACMQDLLPLICRISFCLYVGSTLCLYVESTFPYTQDLPLLILRIYLCLYVGSTSACMQVLTLLICRIYLHLYVGSTSTNMLDLLPHIPFKKFP